ncbi:hypothetical protein [Geoalkalibacter halelectricus]|uniref:hypothetical protein n=1 Tax=Geoalkalibacter halelectricus TaxID=2847045 RepID=UPI00266E9158|nr:hypothetical protein [Geoalkalibacter halelectricus]MDO3380513.1 hypothetical protein [Geoalkalibacter halelectricus]
MIPAELLAKYPLPREELLAGVESALTRTLGIALGLCIQVRINSPLEILAWSRDPGDPRDPQPLDPGSFSRQLRRQLFYQVERELQRRQTLHEWQGLRVLRGQALPGEILRQRSDGRLHVALEIVECFSGLVLLGECPPRAQPPHERPRYRPGEVLQFLVTSILPVESRGLAKILIRLSRVSRALPEALLRAHTGRGDIRCRRRVAGAFSDLTAASSVPREAIRAVGAELKERIRIHVVSQEST